MKRFYTATQLSQESSVLTAFFVLSPLCVVALFAFANFADRTFQDSLPSPRKGFVDANARLRRAARRD
jgi:hypothetical protein